MRKPALASAALILGLVTFGVGCDDSSDKSASSAQSQGSVGAFNAYIAKSKASEAKVSLFSLYQGAKAYYLNTPNPSIEPIPPQLPGPSVGPTPPIGACCKTSGKCEPSAAQWSDPVWQALYFSMDSPHYYSYQYIVDDERKSFTARAIGDLDCDGQYSTFTLSGKAVEGDVQRAPDLIENNPME